MSSEMIFEGDSANNGGALWVSNGTPGGTKRIKLKNQNSGGLVAVGNELGVVGPIVFADGDLVFAEGQDAQNHVGLFVYDVATGVSSELAGAEGSNQFGIDPQDFVAYDGEVYFDGYNSNLFHGLWVTDGAKGAGTHEIAGSPGLPQSMTVYDGSLYMSAIGADGDGDLFSYNASSGKFAEIDQGLAPVSMKAFAVGSSTGALTSELFMNGEISSKGTLKASLVVFKGSKGTYFTNQWANGGVAPSDLTGLDWSTKSGATTVHHGEMFFSGVDNANGGRGLWETNGTTVKELASSAFAGGEGGLDPFDLTAFDGKIYFTGFDKYTQFDDGRGLFVYNPATNTTSELIKSSQLNLSDGFETSWDDLNSFTMGVFGGKLYFGAANPNVGGEASVPQLYQYSGSGSSATLISVAGSGDGGLSPMSFGTT